MSRDSRDSRRRVYKQLSPIHNSGHTNRYIKTLNEDLVSKTELALRLVNQYELRKNKIDIQTTSIIFMTDQDDGPKDIHTNLHEDVDQKINLVGEGVKQYFKIDCRGKAFPVRLQFRKVRNSIRVFCSFREKYPGADKAEYEFMAFKDSRHSMTPRPGKPVIFLYICLEAQAHVGIMDMKVTFYNERLEKLRDGYKFKGKVIVEPLAKINSVAVLTEPAEETKTQLQLPPVTTRETSENKHGFKSRKRLHQSEKVLPRSEKEKLEEAKQRKAQLQLLKEKERQFIEKAASSKDIIVQYEHRQAYEAEQRKPITNNLTALIYLSKFLEKIDFQSKNYVEKMGIYAKFALLQNHAAAKIKKFYRSIISEIPSRKGRAMASLHEGIYFLSKVRRPKAITKSQKIVTFMLLNVAPCMQVNQTFDHATMVRRKLRLIQKYWKAKYHARLNTIKEFAQRHVYTLLDQYVHFRQLEQQFKKENTLLKICLTYIADIAEKFNKMHADYLESLLELQKMKQINEKIKDQNTRLLKKRQRPLLQIPAAKNKPFYRFFRDLDVLKGMLRGWFEIELKKIEKRNKKKQPIKT